MTRGNEICLRRQTTPPDWRTEHRGIASVARRSCRQRASYRLRAPEYHRGRVRAFHIACHHLARRLSPKIMFFADLVDSTALSVQVDPETYRLVVGRYREQVLRIVNGYDGHIGSTKGDGLLAVFGHPITREDDARRAVQAGVEIAREVSRLSNHLQRRFGFGVSVRVGVHWGLV